MRSPCCLYVYMCIPPLKQLLNAATNFYETWFAYHVVWGHLNGVIYKSLPSVVSTLQPPKLYYFIEFITLKT
jgi:hypothetical protein